MALTDDEKDVLRELEQRIDTVASLVRKIAEKTFNKDDRENILGQELVDCHHDLRAVQRLD